MEGAGSALSEDRSHPTPHDALFKRVFGELDQAAALVRSILPPALAARIDWERIELRSGGYVDAELQGLASDLVFSTWVGDARTLLPPRRAPELPRPHRGRAWARGVCGGLVRHGSFRARSRAPQRSASRAKVTPTVATIVATITRTF